MYTAFILISHFILRFGETSVQFGGTLQIGLMLGYIRVIREVRKTQQQNPEFGHTQGEILKKTLQKKTISIQWGMKLRKLSILVIS